MHLLLPLCGILILLKLTVPGFLLPWWAVLAPGVVAIAAFGFWAYLFLSGRMFASSKRHRYRIEWKWKDEDDTTWTPYLKRGRPIYCKYSVDAARFIRTELIPNYVGMEYRYQEMARKDHPFGPAVQVS